MDQDRGAARRVQEHEPAKQSTGAAKEDHSFRMLHAVAELATSEQVRMVTTALRRETEQVTFASGFGAEAATPGGGRSESPANEMNEAKARFSLSRSFARVHVHRAIHQPVTLAEQLGSDAQRNFMRMIGAEIKPDRAVKASGAFGWNTVCD